MKKVLKIIKKWWAGEYIPPPQDDSGIVLIVGHQKYPLTRRILTTLAKFWLKHWKWIITTIFVLIGTIITATRK